MQNRPIQKITVLGGGTAGWMTALIMANAWNGIGIEIELIESPQIGIIGVGEGSTPALKQFFDTLDITESEWMPACNATYKCAIRFDHWSTKPGFECYFHPFSARVDHKTFLQFKENINLYRQGFITKQDAVQFLHPDNFFLSAFLAKFNLAPKPSENFRCDMLYGYHFDSVLLGNFLRKKAIALGVVCRELHVVDVERHGNGDINKLVALDSEKITADFFVDCSGFNSFLIRRLGSEFKDYSDNLLNDAAIALPSDISEEIPSYTLSSALTCGWAWKIPLTNRYGNGYVYSSAFCSADQAEFELRQHLGLLDSPITARHLSMKLGRVTEHWKNNCLAVGLAQGFIEPLEATALFMVQKTIESFVECFSRGNFTSCHQSQFNHYINGYFDGIRDYIVTHYKTSSRKDSEYWRANTANQSNVSEVMQYLYQAWFSGRDLAQTLDELNIAQYYPAPSWYCIFIGMGMFPRPMIAAHAHPHSLECGGDYLRSCASHFPPHKDYLNHLLT